MAKKILNENEQKIINEVKDAEFKKQLTEGFQNGSYMTVQEFCNRLETLKTWSDSNAEMPMCRARAKWICSL